ncbi:MAG: DUF1579 domain-containing protein [Chitinophagaceae bacterium]|nr:MAG: DUF1579 domain-containing protein [Chitinophagaceae bacterium]
MRKTFVILSSLALAFVSCQKAEDKKVTTTTTVATDTVTDAAGAAEKEAPVDQETMMKAWKAYATPGDVHKMMAAETGKWNCEMSFWQGPDSPAEKAKATADIKMVLGGRYQEANYTGTVMGQPFEGKATTGYNNASGKLFTTFYDNMGTGMMHAEGTYDPASKKATYEGKMVDPISGKSLKYREEYVVVDENTRKTSMFDTKNGTEYKSMEIVMVRAK